MLKALLGAIHTYTVKGIVQDLGKALGLPRQELSQLPKQLHSRDVADLQRGMMALDAFHSRVNAPGWAPQLMDAPRLLSQHVGDMVLSSSPIPDMVPVRAGATRGALRHGLGQGAADRGGGITQMYR